MKMSRGLGSSYGLYLAEEVPVTFPTYSQSHINHMALLMLSIVEWAAADEVSALLI